MSSTRYKNIIEKVAQSTAQVIINRQTSTSKGKMTIFIVTKQNF